MIVLLNDSNSRPNDKYVFWSFIVESSSYNSNPIVEG
jgi:hypothetical protein